MIAQLANNQSCRPSNPSLWPVCYWTVIALLFAGAVWQRFKLPLDPIADPDAWGYLSPGLRKLTGAEFGHTNGRNFVYPGFLFLVLRLFGTFRAIAITQHLLGLLAGAVLLLSWKRAQVFVPNPRIGRVGYDLLGLGGAAVVLLQWPTIAFEQAIRPESICTFVLGVTLYFLIQFHANLIRDQLAEDLAKNVTLPYSRDWLERLYLTLRAEIAKSHTARHYAYHSLGFDPDFLMYDRNSIAVQIRREFRGDIAAVCAFYRFYYWRIWQKRPQQVLEKVARQMRTFYLPYCRAYEPRITQKFGGAYQQSVLSLSDPICRKVWTAYPAAVDFMTRTQELGRRELRFQQPLLLPIIPMLVLLASITYSTLLIVALVLAGFVAPISAPFGRLRVFAGLAVFAFLFNAAYCLEVAVISSLDIPRYLTVQMYSTLVAQLLGLWFVLEFVSEMWQRRKQRLDQGTP